MLVLSLAADFYLVAHNDPTLIPRLLLAFTVAPQAGPATMDLVRQLTFEYVVRGCAQFQVHIKGPVGMRLSFTTGESRRFPSRVRLFRAIRPKTQDTMKQWA